MKTLKCYLAVVIGALLLLPGGSLAVASQPQDDGFQFSEGPLDYVAEQSRLVVHNGNLTVWFQEYKPMVHICSTLDEGTNLSFSVGMRGIYEINDSGNPVAFLDMFRAYPMPPGVFDGGSDYTSGMTVTYDQSEQTIDVTFTLEAYEYLLPAGSLKWGDSVPGDGYVKNIEVLGPANVSLVYHISSETAFVKFDLLVSEWTWADTASDRLALVSTIEGHEITDTFGQRPSADGIPVGENHGNETQLLYTVHSTYYRDSVRILGSDLVDMGYLTWADQATALYEDGTGSTVSVSAYMFNGSSCDSASTRIWFTFTVPDGMATAYAVLEYDPVVGMGELLPLSQNPAAPNQGYSALPWYAWPLSGGLAALLTVVCIGLAAVALAVVLVKTLGRGRQ